MSQRKAALQQFEVAEILEHIAGRLEINRGERKLTVTFSDGVLRRSFVEYGPLRPSELAELAGDGPGLPTHGGG